MLVCNLCCLTSERACSRWALSYRLRSRACATSYSRCWRSCSFCLFCSAFLSRTAWTSSALRFVSSIFFHAYTEYSQPCKSNSNNEPITTSLDLTFFSSYFKRAILLASSLTSSSVLFLFTLYALRAWLTLSYAGCPTPTNSSTSCFCSLDMSWFVATGDSCPADPSSLCSYTITEISDALKAIIESF